MRLMESKKGAVLRVKDGLIPLNASLRYPIEELAHSIRYFQKFRAAAIG